MRRPVLQFLALIVAAGPAFAQGPTPPGNKPKDNPNPCRDEVSAALQKLRKSSWFRMTTTMITEQGPTSMEVDYVLPDKMHQKVTVQLTKQQSEIKLIGDKAWSKQGEGAWQGLKPDVTEQLRTQLQENVVDQQTDVGNYACKGRTDLDGKSVLSYKLEDEPAKESTAPKNEAYRMFYVDTMTGLPVSNALVVQGREGKPIFKAVYAYPLDLKIEPPADEAPAPAPAAAPSTAPAPAVPPATAPPAAPQP